MVIAGHALCGDADARACRCCGLPPGHDMIEFDKDCKWDNFMAPNFTAARPYARAPKTLSIEAAAADSQWQAEAAAKQHQAAQQRRHQQPRQQGVQQQPVPQQQPQQPQVFRGER